MVASARKSWIEVNQARLAYLGMPFAQQAALSSMLGTHTLLASGFPALFFNGYQNPWDLQLVQDAFTGLVYVTISIPCI